jgi:hypothetical protein
VFDETGKDVPNPYSDVWILLLTGREPYEFRNLPYTVPINFFKDADLQLLLRGGKK